MINPLLKSSGLYAILYTANQYQDSSYPAKIKEVKKIPIFPLAQSLRDIERWYFPDAYMNDHVILLFKTHQTLALFHQVHPIKEEFKQQLQLVAKTPGVYSISNGVASNWITQEKPIFHQMLKPLTLLKLI